MVVLVDGFGGGGWVVRLCEDGVAGAPLLGEEAPVGGGEVGGAETDDGRQGGCGGGEGVGGAGLEGVRYGGAPVDDCAEDVEEEGFGGVGVDGHGGQVYEGVGVGLCGELVGWLVGWLECWYVDWIVGDAAAVRGQVSLVPLWQVPRHTI